MEMSEKPKVVVKVKHMPLILDYCIENKLKFSASPRLTPDEWEFELGITDIMGAVALGMFLRENRLEMLGMQTNTVKTQAAKSTKVAKAVTAKKAEQNEVASPEVEAINTEVFAVNEFVEEPTTSLEPVVEETNEFAAFSTVDEFTTDNGSQTNDLLFG